MAEHDIASLLAKKIIRKNTTQVSLGPFTVESTDYVVNGNTDSRYENYKDLWELIPRGYCEFSISDEDDAINGTLVGLRKFGYDEYTGTDAVYEYYTTKENGECFHITARIFKNKIFWIGGSKNVHGVVRHEYFMEDLDLWTKERFGYFKQFMRTFYMMTKGDDRIQHFAFSLDLAKKTACAEICDTKRQHLVRYPKTEIRFFAFTVDQPSTEHGLTFGGPIPQQHEMFKMFGLDVVEECVKVRMDDMDKRKETRNYFFQKHNSEGAVVYVCDKAGRVLHIYKWKNERYIIERAFREKIRSQASVGQIRHRINNLHIHVEDKEEITEWYLRFYSWFKTKVADGTYTWNYLQNNWLDTKMEFQKLPYIEQETIEIFDNEPTYLLVMVSPCPGVGKTTLALEMERKFPNTWRINQDELGGNKRLFMKNVQKGIDDPALDFLILDKNHSTDKQRKEYDQFNLPIIFINWYHPEDNDTEKIYKLAMERITARGKNHPSVYASNASPIVRKFLSTWEQIYESENVIHVDMTLSTENQFKYVQEELSTHLGRSILEIPRKERTPLYWSANVDLKTNTELAEKINELEHFSKKKSFTHKFQQDFHMTLFFLSDLEEPERTKWNKYWSSREGESLEFQIPGFVYDERAICFLVDLKNGDTIQKKNPHITLGTRRGTQPVYSNQLLEDKNAKVEIFSEPIKCCGIIVKNF